MQSKVGSFCWLEVGTTNTTAAKTYYSNLYGWAVEDLQMGPDMAYTIFPLGDTDVPGA